MSPLCTISMDINSHFSCKVKLITDNSHFLPPAYELWGKLMFLHLSVILFTGWSTLLGHLPSEGGLPSGGKGLPSEGVCLNTEGRWSTGGQYTSH